ncbi:MAG: hypothetical protein KDI63_08830 [Gammaproteobacteria bacterium]|nr:hypothetical protein [Gammaproteobacteria bacterium]
MKLYSTCLAIVLTLLMTSAMAQQDILIEDKISDDEIKVEVVALVLEKQDEYVKDSINQYNCFTEEDYKRFRSSNTITKIVEELKKDEYFLGLVAGTVKLSPIKRHKIYREAKKTYKKTWAELGKISPEGQTDAGSEAEKEISSAISKLLKDLVEASAKN